MLLKSFCRLYVSLSTLNFFLPSLIVFANFKYRVVVFACPCLSLGVFVNFKHLILFAIFVCNCPSLCVFVNFKRLFTVFACLCPSMFVFARLCVSLPVFARLCVSLRSMGVFAVFR